MVRRAALALFLVSTPALAQDDGAAAWDKIYKVLHHPRCSNCHVGENNIPMWSGEPHGMYINAGKSGPKETRDGSDFVPCGACHGIRNSQLPHGPPGADGEWSLPPPSMQWSGKSSAEICNQIKKSDNPSLRSLAEFTKHVKSGLVRWAWDPGAGRDGPQVSEDDLIASFTEWDAAKRPCPSE